MPSRLRRLLPPLALCAGVLLFALSLVVIGAEAAEERPRPLDPSSLTTANGTAVLAYPTQYFGVGSGRIEVSYTFPSAPGDALVVDCMGYADLLRGDNATPMLAFTGVQEGRFVVSGQTLSAEDFRSGDEEEAETFCEPVIAFRWGAGDDPDENRPDASVAYHGTPFDMGRSGVLLILLTAGVLFALVGGLTWARTRSSLPSADDSALEVLRASLDRMGEQLRRARRHLLFAGVLGVFLWYPVLVPWAWRQAARTNVDALFPWVFSGLTLAFLVVMTVLWARELRRLDAELNAWRARMGELRERESSLLESLKGG